MDHNIHISILRTLYIYMLHYFKAQPIDWMLIIWNFVGALRRKIFSEILQSACAIPIPKRLLFISMRDLFPDIP